MIFLISIFAFSNSVSVLTVICFPECLKFINSVKISSKNLNNTDKEKIQNTFEAFIFDILGLKKNNKGTLNHDNKSSDLIKLLIKLRNQSRANRNFELSDQIRDDLMELGIQLYDDKNESSFKIIK